jgi:hypothetical protein
MGNLTTSLDPVVEGFFAELLVTNTCSNPNTSIDLPKTAISTDRLFFDHAFGLQSSTRKSARRSEEEQTAAPLLSTQGSTPRR